ncbi:carbohydrate ABC transporter permease [Gracilibacillus salinarum]|uniref:Sugar ABC transporter permease n=1 Tax=Gracilibacillus salinarum TaxID=2932255 RepID=A0ABY4GRX5_9BACI|nr:sugar ABC transporter permease [Gracilibacillus salinarum]UOQ86976.1 sugar ABC transporter permease [Gracilibacillus salinarum]
MGSKNIKRQKYSREQQRRFTAMLLIIPSIIFLVGLIAYPLVKVVIDSFRLVNLTNVAVSGFAGFENYVKVLTNEHFQKALSNTVIWTLLSVIGEFIFGMITAVALNNQVKGVGFFRSLIIIPFVVPVVVAGLTWEWMLSPDFGIINYLFEKIGLISESVNWLGEKETALLTVTFVNIWRSFPFYTVTLLAALQSIPHDIIEAAAVDGANAPKRFMKIIFPQLKSVSMVLIGMHLIWTSINFDYVWVMTEGGPFYATETLPVQIYRYAMKQYDVGAASALSTMMIGLMTIGFVTYFYIKKVRSKSEGIK